MNLPEIAVKRPIATVMLSMALGLALALLLDQKLKGRNLVRSVVFAPFVISGAAIGVAVANLAVVLNPDIVIVGGELAQTEDVFLEPIRAAVNRRVLISRDETLEVRRGELHSLAAVQGALAHAADLAHVTGVE